jgi:hypothetical protein
MQDATGTFQLFCGTGRGYFFYGKMDSVYVFPAHWEIVAIVKNKLVLYKASFGGYRQVNHSQYTCFHTMHDRRLTNIATYKEGTIHAMLPVNPQLLQCADPITFKVDVRW